MAKRYQVFFRVVDNPDSNGVADVSQEYLNDFSEGKIIDHILEYEDDFDPYQYSHREKSQEEKDMDYDKSRHRIM